MLEMFEGGGLQSTYNSHVKRIIVGLIVIVALGLA